MSASQIGKKHTAESLAKMSAWQKGRKLSPERCAEIALTNTGKKKKKKKHSLETRMQMSYSRMGKTRTAESIVKQKKSRRSHITEVVGILPPWSQNNG